VAGGAHFREGLVPAVGVAAERRGRGERLQHLLAVGVHHLGQQFVRPLARRGVGLLEQALAALGLDLGRQDLLRIDRVEHRLHTLRPGEQCVQGAGAQLGAVALPACEQNLRHALGAAPAHASQ
jgi:hypothetical protein